MNNRKLKYSVLFVLLVGLLTLSTGCIEAIVGGGMATFGAGYWFGATTVPTVTSTQCFVNGEEIACANVPE